MSEFFLELFSEEIPAKLQKNSREKIFEDFLRFFEQRSIKSKRSFSLSSPNRLVIVFEGLDKQIKIESEEIKGPKISAPDQAINGFLRSNKIEKKDMYTKKNEKDEFYFFRTKCYFATLYKLREYQFCSTLLYGQPLTLVLSMNTPA